MNELNRSDSPFLHPIYNNDSNDNGSGTLNYDKEDVFNFDRVFKEENAVNRSIASLNTKSMLSLGQTESSKSIYTYCDNHNVIDSNSFVKGLGIKVEEEDEREEDEDILSSFIDINKLQSSIDEFAIDFNHSNEGPTSGIKCEYQTNHLDKLSSPISLMNGYNKSWTNVPNIPTTKVMKPRSLPPKSPIRASASSHTLRNAISSDRLHASPVLRPASPSMAQAAARLAASNLKAKSKDANINASANSNNNTLLATVSAAHAMGNSSNRDQKTLRKKQRQKRNQTFQHWMTTFQKEEPKPVQKPQVYKRMDEGLMNFQVNIKPIQDNNQK